MHKWKLIPLLAIILSGCAQQPQLPRDPRLAAWDGLGRSPNLAKPEPRLRVRHPGAEEEDLLERQKVLETVRLYSRSWWLVHDEIEAARDAILAKKLVICRGCFEPVTAYPDSNQAMITRQ
jgi:hypothetical protein